MSTGFLKRWLGGPAGARAAPPPLRSGPAGSQFVSSQGAAAAGTHADRKDLLRTAMREMLQRNGIPEAWLSADLLRTSSPNREQGIHVRLLVRHWEPRLLLHAVALEQAFLQRLVALDPAAVDWMTGFSWQLALADVSACPDLPSPDSWTAPRRRPPATAQQPPATRPGDIIAGPVRIPQSQEDVRADLERLLALRDDAIRRSGPGDDGFAATRPATF